MGEKLTAEDRTKIEEVIAKLEAAIKGTEVEAIRNAKAEHDKVWGEVSERLYTAGAAQQPETGTEAGGEAAGTSTDGNVEEADYTIVDDEGKS
jgi:molecular chaperone DnaK